MLVKHNSGVFLVQPKKHPTMPEKIIEWDVKPGP